MKKTFFLLLLIFISFSIQAQYQHPYTGALGIRLGAANGITAKYMWRDEVAIEGIVLSRWGGWYLTGLFEVVRPLSAPDNVYWYVGVGGHVGRWDGEITPVIFDDPEEEYSIIGVDGILGMEYTFDKLPLNFSLDWKPSFNLAEHTGFWGDEVALSVRIVLLRK